MIGQYTYMNAPEWELSVKKVLIAILIVLIIIAVGIVSLFAIKYPRYQEQVNASIVVENQTQYRLVQKYIAPGTYRYAEYVPPNQTWDYTLVVSNKNTAVLSIEGAGINTSINATLSQYDDLIKVAFNSYVPGKTGEHTFARGDDLFYLKRMSATKQKVIWANLMPVLVDQGIPAEFLKK
ncbi:MAG: DUF5991 domain-containing protein [bacterium]|nr:DUF5991 domain-containing protein [bacterium]